jgi:hypothetical protein
MNTEHAFCRVGKRGALMNGTNNASISPSEGRNPNLKPAHYSDLAAVALSLTASASSNKTISVAHESPLFQAGRHLPGELLASVTLCIFSAGLLAASRVRLSVYRGTAEVKRQDARWTGSTPPY